MFHHYIITRFNLRNPKWEAENNGKTLLTEAWMKERFWLFENFCLPSVKTQSNKNFTWLLYFDTSTSITFKNKITKLVQDSPHFVPQFIEGMPVYYESIKAYISKNSQNKRYLITTRIDNDDSIHVDFVKTIQNQFKQQKYHVVDLLKGYSLQIKPQIILGKKDHIFNPFISLIEENINPKTVWHNSHNTWKTEKNVTFIKNKRLWMVVIHQDNKTNNFNGYGKVSWNDLKQHFILSPEMSQTIEKNALNHQQWFQLSLKNRIIVKYKVFSKFFKRSLGIYQTKK
ncbi:MAG: glycosyltransferase [Flavobacteriales bacterium]